MAAPITRGTLATGGVALTVGERYSIISLIFFVRRGNLADNREKG